VHCAIAYLHQAENGQAEISLQHKSEVQQRIQTGESQRKLAKQYGVSKSKIGNIKNNKHSIINAVEGNRSQNRKRKIKKTETKRSTILYWNSS
jgi:DNA-binding XRE family transcriptional regulator